MAYQAAMSFRFSHYFVSFLSECTCLLSGIGTEVNQEGKQIIIWCEILLMSVDNKYKRM